MASPRSYMFHSTATINYLLANYSRQPMREIAEVLDIPAKKLYKLAEREKIQKTKGKK